MSLINAFNLLGDDDQDDIAPLMKIHEEKAKKKAEEENAARKAAKELALKEKEMKRVLDETNEIEAYCGVPKTDALRGKHQLVSSYYVDETKLCSVVRRDSEEYEDGNGLYEEFPRKRVDANGSVQGGNQGHRRQFSDHQSGNGYGNVGQHNERSQSECQNGYVNGKGQRQFVRRNEKISNVGSETENTQEPMATSKTEDGFQFPKKSVRRDRSRDSANSNKKENVANEVEDKEPAKEGKELAKEDKVPSKEVKEVMTLTEYEKMRKPVLSMKTTEERTVDSKGFESMKLLKKGNHEIFVKLGSEKDGAKRKEDANSKADKVKKVSQAQTVLKFIYPRPERGRGRGDNQGRTHGDNQGRGRGENQGRDNGDNNGRMGTADNQERFNGENQYRGRSGNQGRGFADNQERFRGENQYSGRGENHGRGRDRPQPRGGLPSSSQTAPPKEDFPALKTV